MPESILNSLEILRPYLSPLIITSLVWITYFYTLRCGFVSDDVQGLAEYDGKLQGPEYGMLWRWVRYHIVGGTFPSGQKNPDGSDVPQGKHPVRSHFLSISVFNVTCITTYYALTPIIGSKLALLSVIVLIVHPCTTQGVAWISGLAYPLSLFWISCQVLLLQYFYPHQSLNTAIWVLPVFCLIQWLSIHAIFATTAMTWALLLFLGYWQFAILSFVISVIMCMDQIRKIVALRVTEFKKQHMGQSTVFHWRKGIVALKTLAYYVGHSLFPRSMGLYHVWGFHYDKKIELADRRFFAGLLILVTLICVFFKTSLVPIQLGILWYLIFSTGFWNWITAQQFVTERYIMVANLGLGILIATLTQDCFWVYTFIVGAYLVRTWVHLPTYDNELRFYQSNHWQFPNSEVALGNLGVTYARIGLPDSAKDHWHIAANINQDYDVPWVNIFYQHRTNGMTLINNGDYVAGLKKLQEGLPFLKKALSCKICHFPEQWRVEYAELASAIQNPALLFQNELHRLIRLEEDLRNMMMKANDHARISELELSIKNNSNQIEKLVEFVSANGFILNLNTYNAYKLLDKIRR